MELVHSNRKDRRINKSQQVQLKETLNLFTKECMGKSEAQIKEIYRNYDKRWVEYSIKTNETKKYIVYADAFEEVVDKFVIAIPKLKTKVSPFIYTRYEVIYKALKKRNIFQKVLYFLSKHFFSKSNG